MKFRPSSGDRFDGGDGTAENPYLISNVAQFQKISEGLDRHYRIIRDLDFKNTGYTSIGSLEDKDNFTGVLDGNHKTISNVKCAGKTASTALFACIGLGGEIKNITLKNSSFISSNGNKESINEADKDVGAETTNESIGLNVIAVSLTTV